MTIEDVRLRLAQIRAMSSDDESAHAEEDQLYKDVLTEIARLKGATDHPPAVWAAEMAAEALKAREIGFSRWYA